MDAIIEAAIKLSQGAPITILVFVVIALMYACKKLFEAYQKQTETLIPAINEMSSAFEKQTQTLQDMAQKSDVNTLSQRAVKEVLESLLTRLDTWFKDRRR